MASNLYIGVRVESSNVTIGDTALLESTCSRASVSGIHIEGRVVMEKPSGMIVARGKIDGKSAGDNLVNFALMAPAGSKANALRFVKIINVLGNDKLIKERVSTFMNEESVLNEIPELSFLMNAFAEIDDKFPGFVSSSWYYAPEAKLR